jgi:hypothetical protein
MYGPLYYRHNTSINEEKETNFKRRLSYDVAFSGQQFCVEAGLYSDQELTQLVGRLYSVGESRFLNDNINVKEHKLTVSFPEGTLNAEYRTVIGGSNPSNNPVTIFARGINGSVAGEEFKAIIQTLPNNVRKLEFVIPV